MSDIDVTRLLSEMRAMAARVQGNEGQKTNSADGADFGALLKRSVDKVNETQAKAGEMARGFEAGDKNADLAEVMIAMQKANVSFRAMTEVRNRLVSAYQEIMNMPI